MLHLKACFGRFRSVIVFVCLLTQSLLSIDSSTINSSDHESLDAFMHKYNEYGAQYAYLNDEPLDISLELDSVQQFKKGDCEKESKESQVNHYTCRVCQSHCCKKDRFQKFFSFYDAGKIILVLYVIYRTRNVIRVAVITANKTVTVLDYFFEHINYYFGMIGGLNGR